MAEEKKRIDWEKVEKLYRAGKLSIREVSRQCGCTEGAIRKRAKAESWTRDLSDKIDEVVRTKLVRSEVRTSGAISEKEIIEAAATKNFEIVTAERKDLKELQDMESKLMAELNDSPTKSYVSSYQGVIISESFKLTVAERASALLALANVRTKRIELERKIYGIADPVPKDPADVQVNAECTVQLDPIILSLIPSVNQTCCYDGSEKP